MLTYGGSEHVACINVSKDAFLKGAFCAFFQKGAEGTLAEVGNHITNIIEVRYPRLPNYTDGLELPIPGYDKHVEFRANCFVSLSIA